MINKNISLVTIGIPFYNADQYLFQTISSVINQTYKNWELILLDDGSTDNSLKIARSFSDKRIIIISDGENKGLIHRLNQLTFLAKGEFYARMDSDDIMHFDRIRIQVNYLLTYPEVDLVGSSYYSIDLNNIIIGKTNVNFKPDSVRNILKHGCFAHPSVFGRTIWFKKNQYDKAYHRMEDIELWLRTVSFSNFRNIDVPLLFYRNVGIPTLKKYINSNLGIIKLLQQRRKYGISIPDSLMFTIRYFVKILVYFFFFSIGKINYLIKKRSLQIDSEECWFANTELLNSIEVHT